MEGFFSQRPMATLSPPRASIHAAEIETFSSHQPSSVRVKISFDDEFGRNREYICHLLAQPLRLQFSKSE